MNLPLEIFIWKDSTGWNHIHFVTPEIKRAMEYLHGTQTSDISEDKRNQTNRRR